ncbi:hypothetical protein, partial [Metallibacterium sp.]|uniref:hypothetical protein n=1 Tax=Metallibacterium sp. TaxID=2940281 RepID=UPI0026024562
MYVFITKSRLCDLRHGYGQERKATRDQFAKPGILPRFASKRARQSRTTFVATSTCVLVAAAHPCAGAVLQTA